MYKVSRLFGAFLSVFTATIYGGFGQTIFSVENGTGQILKASLIENKASHIENSEPLGLVGPERLELDWINRPTLGLGEETIVRSYKIIPVFPAVPEDFGYPIIVRITTRPLTSQAEMIAGGKTVTVEPFKAWPKVRISPYVEAELQCYLNLGIPDFALILKPISPKDYIEDFAVAGKLAVLLDNQTKTRWAVTLTGLEPKPITNLVGENVIKRLALLPENPSKRTDIGNKIELRLNPLVNSSNYRPQQLVLGQLTTQDFPVVSRCLTPWKCVPIANEEELSQYVNQRFVELVERLGKGELKPDSAEAAWLSDSPETIIKNLKQEIDSSQKNQKTSIEIVRNPGMLRIIIKDI